MFFDFYLKVYIIDILFYNLLQMNTILKKVDNLLNSLEESENKCYCSNCEEEYNHSESEIIITNEWKVFEVCPSCRSDEWDIS